MTRPTGPELLATLRSADPLADPDQDAVDAQHLISSRAVLDARLRLSADGPTASPVRRRRVRRLVALTAAFTALPIAAVVVLPGVAALLGEELPGSPLAGTAVAGNGGLECGSGYARAIRPDTAEVRLWPTVVPSGWRPNIVFAREGTATGWCKSPSLVAARTGANGIVTGTVKIIGPARGIDVTEGDGVGVADRVGGRPAIRLSGADVPDYYSWVLTDDTGEQWYAAVHGYPLTQARNVLAAAGFQDRKVVWDDSAVAETRVLHRRTGEPYPVTTRGLYWQLNYLTAGNTAMQGRLSQGDEPNLAFSAVSGPTVVPVIAEAVVGSRFQVVGGRMMNIMHEDGRPTGVYADIAPGVQASSAVHGNLADITAMLASLRSLDADDPRLDTYALKEEYED